MSLFSRAASLAAVPVKSGARFAGAATQTVFGADRDTVYEKATTASVEAMAAALAKARGPALKFGQVLALFASTLPPEQARVLASLGQLYENATPRPWTKIEPLLKGLPDGVTVDPEAVAAASLGQVHRGTWVDGTPVAVKVQYPDAHRIVRADMMQLRTFVPLVHRMMPGLDVKALLAEHEDRLWEELDYTREGRSQEAFRTAWERAYPGVVTIPRVLHSEPTVLVTEWLEGTPFAALKDAPVEERDAVGRGLARFVLWSPALLGMIHADPHPGNYRLMPDGTLGVLDFGSIGHPVGAFTHLYAETYKLGVTGSDQDIHDLWVETGMAPATTSVEDLLRIIALDVTPYTEELFTFGQAWMSARSQAWADPNTALSDVNMFALPPSLLMEHRAVGGMLALLCSVSATVDFQTVLDGVPRKLTPVESY